MKHFRTLSDYWRVIVPILAAILAISLAGVLWAQQSGTQVVEGNLEKRSGDYYVVPDLQQGQTVTVRVETTSGNLDPVVGIVDSGVDGITLLEFIRKAYNQSLQEGADPISAANEMASGLFVAWNDDGAEDSSAILTYRIPADGDYHLLITSGLRTESFGDYRMRVDIEPIVEADGDSDAHAASLVQLESKLPPAIVAVDEIVDVYRTDRRDAIYQIRDLDAGDTVYAYVETVSGEASPVLKLLNYREKPLLIDNYGGESQSATLQYTAEQDTENLYILIAASGIVSDTEGLEEDAETAPQFRLLVGVNDESALSGAAEPNEYTAIVNPKVVQIGVQMDQVTNVDQVSENFGAVVEMRMEWTDPKLAFNPDDCRCAFQTFTQSAFDDYMADAGVEAWPVTTLYNQQGRRDEQGYTIVVTPDGHAIATVRFTATFQAPDFNFRLFPFDKQVFHIRARSSFPEEFFVYTDLPGYSDLGTQLGEEEWMITDWETSIDTSDDRSLFNFTFHGKRHIDYYLYRIFLPLLIIILVSWAIFFLRNYEKRVDAAAANLLLLIAFNFTISGNLPKLGYLTLMDIVLITTFVVTGLVLVLNVFLRRMEVAGKREQAERLDRYVLWLYPLIYIIFIGGIALLFFSNT